MSGQARCDICNQPINQNHRTKVVTWRDGTVRIIHATHHEYDQDVDAPLQRR